MPPRRISLPRDERAVRRAQRDFIEEDSFLANGRGVPHEDSGDADDPDKASPAVSAKRHDPVPHGMKRTYLPSGNYIDEEEEQEDANPNSAIGAPDPSGPASAIPAAPPAPVSADAPAPVGAAPPAQLPENSKGRSKGRRAVAWTGRQLTRGGAALRSNMANGGILRTVGIQVGLELSKPAGVPVQVIDAARGLGVASTVLGRKMIEGTGEKTTDVAGTQREEFTRLAEAGRAFRSTRRGEDVDPSAMPSDRASRVATNGLKARALATDAGEERAGLPAVKRKSRLANFFDFRRLAQNARAWWRDAAVLPRVYGTILAPIARLIKKSRRRRKPQRSTEDAPNPILNQPQTGAATAASSTSDGYEDSGILQRLPGIKQSTMSSGVRNRIIDDMPLQPAPEPRREDFSGMNDDDNIFNAALENARSKEQASSSRPPDPGAHDVGGGGAKAPSDIVDVEDDQESDTGTVIERVTDADGDDQGSDNGTVMERVEDELGDARAGLSRDYRYAGHGLGAAQSAKRIAGAFGRELVGLDPYNPITDEAGSSIAKHWISARPDRRDSTRPDLTTDQWSEALERDPNATRELRRRQEAHAMQSSPALQAFMQQWNLQRAAQGKPLLGPKTSPAALDQYRSDLTNPDAYQAPDGRRATEVRRPRLQGFGFRNAVLAHRAALKLGTEVGFQGHRPEFEYTMAQSAQAENMQAVREAEPRMRAGESTTPALKEDDTLETQGEAEARWGRQHAKAVRFVREGAGGPLAGTAPIAQTTAQRNRGVAAQWGAAILPRSIDAFGQVLANEDTGLDDLDQGNNAKATVKAVASSIRNAAVTTGALGLAAGSAPMSYATFPLVDGTARVAGGLISGFGRTVGQVTGLEGAARRQDRIDHYNKHWFGAKKR